MGARDLHLEQARSNRAHLRRLLAMYSQDIDPNVLRWAVTAAFYSAVHCIEAELESNNLHSGTHRDRAALMKRVGVPPEIRRAYELLKDFSEDARYRIATFEVYWVRETIVDKYLDRIVRWAKLDADIPSD